MCNAETEQKFEDYRHYLQYEASRLASYVALYRRLYERRADRLEEMNISPAFFSVTTDALFSAIILWTDKLFDEHAERGILNFLTFVEYNRGMFAIEQLKRRRNYPDGHWMLDIEPIKLETIIADRKRIREFACLQSFPNEARQISRSLRQGVFLRSRALGK